MIIVYTCPKCGHDLNEFVLTANPHIYHKECPNCHWSWQSTPEPIRRIPFIPDPIEETIPTVKEFTPFASPACWGCVSNPANGGDGICHCILGQNIIY